ncbi:MAG: CDP-diacylglycerol--glycerol-3-phosphate 3-phosphatidyltransferase [Ignavibacteriae bacterium]|nr:CDP-diacylglycerol--glycerol-3-phosphate 3-phosphatidyltransferase [Ignavibacteriota bacterium]
MSLPNSLTALRILLTPIFVAFLFSESPFFKQLSLVVFIVAALTDYYDGWVARKYGDSTRFGKYLDPLADKILSSAALFSYVYLDLVSGWMVWIIVVRDFLITGLRSYAEYKDQPIVTSRPAQAKTFGEYVVIYYILILHVASSVHLLQPDYGSLIETLMDSRVLFGMMLLVTLMSVGTGAMYVFEYRKFIQEIYSNTLGKRNTT